MKFLILPVFSIVFINTLQAQKLSKKEKEAIARKTEAYITDANKYLLEKKYLLAYSNFSLALNESKGERKELVPLMALMYLQSKTQEKAQVVIKSDNAHWSDEGKKKSYAVEDFRNYINTDSTNADVYLALAGLCLEVTPDMVCYQKYYDKAMKLANYSQAAKDGLEKINQYVTSVNNRNAVQLNYDKLKKEALDNIQAAKEDAFFSSINKMEKTYTSYNDFILVKLHGLYSFKKYPAVVHFADSVLRNTSALNDSLLACLYQSYAYRKMNKNQQSENAAAFFLAKKYKNLYTRIEEEQRRYFKGNSEDFDIFLKSVNLLENQSTDIRYYEEIKSEMDFYNVVNKSFNFFKEGKFFISLYWNLAILHNKFRWIQEGTFTSYVTKNNHQELETITGLQLASFNDPYLKEKGEERISRDSAFYKAYQKHKIQDKALNYQFLIDSLYKKLNAKEREWEFWKMYSDYTSNLLQEKNPTRRSSLLQLYAAFKKEIVERLEKTLVLLESTKNGKPNLIASNYFFDLRDFATQVIAKSKEIKNNGPFSTDAGKDFIHYMIADYEQFIKEHISLTGSLNNSISSEALAKEIRTRWKNKWTYY